MKTKEIRDLIDFISETGLNEVNIETEELKLSVKRSADVHAQVAPAVAVQAAAQPVAATPVAVSADTSAAASASENSNYVEIKSPMIGTFYRSANPESAPFVHVGDTVSAGQTVCIVEAMKLFNEIESEVSGTIVKMLVDNATPVEYDQPLFLVDPS
jgi:acetyl-CoA carboxylase biotin carboxyl carrier protein